MSPRVSGYRNPHQGRRASVPARMILVGLLLVVLSVVLLTVDSQLIPADTAAATFYYSHGEQQDLDFTTSRVLVRFAEGTADKARQEILSLGQSGITQFDNAGGSVWSVAHLQDSPSDANLLRARISDLLTEPSIAYAAPVFDIGDDHWAAPTAQIHLRIDPAFATEIDRIVDQYAPGAKILKRNVGAMRDAYRIETGKRNGFDVFALANAFSEDARVLWAEPNFRFTGRPALIPNDPGWDQLWGMYNTGQFAGIPGYDIDADSAWDLTIGDSLTRVLILESGVEPNHPDIHQGPAEDFLTVHGTGGPLSGWENHGTAVAGCVSAIINNELGTIGVAPGCQILSARVYEAVESNGSWITETSALVDALYWGWENGARVCNNSNWVWGEAAFRDALWATYDSGMVHFASAMNDASITNPLPPINFISAVNSRGELADFSNYGSGIAFAAPGVSVYVTDRTGAPGYVNGDYRLGSGTSFACPYAAGVAALIASWEPDLSAPEIEQRMRCSARDLGEPGWDGEYGFGLVNAYNALTFTGGADVDGDGVGDLCDNCPGLPNMDQTDSDADGIGDACDACPFDRYNDADGDGVCADVDNCPTIYNPDQQNADGSWQGDRCQCSRTARNIGISPGNTGEKFGWAIDAVQDFDGDSLPEIIVGRSGFAAPSTDPGTAYIYSTTRNIDPRTRTFPPDLTAVITGENGGDWFGCAVAGLGDINGDGFDDVAVGALGYDGGTSNTGAVYVFLGRADAPPMSLAATDAWRKVTGLGLGDLLGSKLARMDDINGDGFSELLIGAPQFTTVPGYVMVYSPAADEILATIPGEGPGDHFGEALSGLGDVNFDGIPDFIIGAPQNDAGGSNAGRAYVYSGASFTLLHTLTGGDVDANLGTSVGGWDDYNSDGAADMIVGAPGKRPGTVIVYSGLDGTEFYTIVDHVEGSALGGALADMGDWDHDGIGDFLASDIDIGVIHGYSGALGVPIVYALEFNYNNENYGTCITGSVDWDHDGGGDVIAGQPFFSNGTGRVIVALWSDGDGDSFPAKCDNCPAVYNPDQAKPPDREASSYGSVCYPCVCPNHGDPNGDGFVNVLDVVSAIDHAFRGAGGGDYYYCAYVNEDVNCDSAVNVLDVVHYVNVAFRGHDPTVDFCVACPDTAATPASAFTTMHRED